MKSDYTPNTTFFRLRLFASSHLTTCVLIFLAMYTPVHAGSLSFSCASWERVSGGTIYYFAKPLKQGEELEKTNFRPKSIDLPTMTRSQRYTIKGEKRQIVFYRKERSKAGEPTMKQVASIRIPEGWNHTLLVFFPNKNGESFRILPIRDDRELSPFGSYRLVNLSEQPVNGFLGKSNFTISPGKQRLLRLSGDEVRRVNFGVWNEQNGRRVWLQRNTLTYKPTKYLVYFFHSEKDRYGRHKLSSKGIVTFKRPEQHPTQTEHQAN